MPTDLLLIGPLSNPGGFKRILENTETFDADLGAAALPFRRRFAM